MGEPRQDMSSPGDRRPFELPSLPSMTRAERHSPPAPRLAGVMSILNHPTNELAEEHLPRNVPVDSPRQTLPPILTKAGDANANSRAASPPNSSNASTENAPRHILTPVSPSMHRPGSFGAINPPSQGTVSTRESPFATSPPMQTFSLPSGMTTPSESNDSHVTIPVSASSGLNNPYELLTLSTSSGTFKVPVDTQAASRAADEKRRRNAGASARFRQRRKEKEKESSSTIHRLEQKARELREDADFYRQERDFFRSLVVSQPGSDRHFPRPSSPRLRRDGPRAAMNGSAPSGMVKKEPRSPSQTADADVWTPYPPSKMYATGPRQTASSPPQQHPPTYHHAGPLPHHPHHGPMQQPAMGPSRSASMPLQAMVNEQPRYDYQRHPQPHGPAHLAHGHQHRHGPPQPLHAHSQTGPSNPFATDMRINGPHEQMRHERRSQ